MSDEVEFLYNTRPRRPGLDSNFHARLEAALSHDIQRNPEEEIDGIDVDDPFRVDEDGNDSDYVPEEDASDIETDIVIEPNKIIDSDNEMEERTKCMLNIKL